MPMERRISPGRKPLSAMEAVVVALDDKADPKFTELAKAWVAYVKEYLGTESWRYGYGYVGEVS